MHLYRVSLGETWAAACLWIVRGHMQGEQESHSWCVQSRYLLAVRQKWAAKHPWLRVSYVDYERALRRGVTPAECAGGRVHKKILFCLQRIKAAPVAWQKQQHTYSLAVRHLHYSHISSVQHYTELVGVKMSDPPNLDTSIVCSAVISFTLIPNPVFLKYKFDSKSNI